MITRIRTTKVDATDTVGAKITARGGGRQVSIPYPHEPDWHDAHKRAAMALADKLGLEEPHELQSIPRGLVFAAVPQNVPCPGCDLHAGGAR